MIGSWLVGAVDFSGSAELISKLKSVAYKRQVLLFHLPKCGGTSLSHYFRLRYAASHFRLREETASRVVSPETRNGAEWMDFKRDLFLYHALDGTHFVQGHVAYDADKFAPLLGKAHFITLMRDPIDRIMSIYYFDKRLAKMDFGEFLNSPRGRIETSAYCRFFGHLPFDASEPTEAHRDTALENLDHFSLVGILEEPQLLERQLSSALGMSFKLPLRNVGESRKQAKESGSDIDQHRDQLREKCRLDMEIYEAMVTRARRQGRQAA